MIIREIIRLFFAIMILSSTLAIVKENCSFWSKNKLGNAKMPLLYTINDQQLKSTVIYPDKNGHLKTEHDASIVMSCVSTNFTLGILNQTNEIIVKCIGGNRVRYMRKCYYYFELECQHVPRSTTIVTNRVCQPNNNTVVRVGFQTRNLFFPLYNVCYDMTNKNSLYTWFNLRIPFYDHHQHRPRLRFFTKDEVIFNNVPIDIAYSKYKQQETLNTILKLNLRSHRYFNYDENFLSRGHYAPKTEFYYAREQAATFNYVNVVPQWRQLNFHWTEVEEAVKRELAADSHSRRVLVTGSYGSCTLPDADGVHQPLYLVMPQKMVPVPMFVFKLVYDADNERNSVVYIGLNNPFVDEQTVERARLKCDRRPCPANIGHFNGTLLHCCTRESFERAYVGRFDPDVLRLSPPRGLISA